MKELLSVTGASAAPRTPTRTMVNCHGHLTFISFSTEATSVQFMALCVEENDFRELLSFEITLWAETASFLEATKHLNVFFWVLNGVVLTNIEQNCSIIDKKITFNNFSVHPSGFPGKKMSLQIPLNNSE